MSTVSGISGAIEAMKLANSALGETGEAIPLPTASGVRTSRHWSYWLLTISATVGAVTAVAAYILNIGPGIYGGIALLVTNAIGAHYIRQLDMGRELNDYVVVMANQIKVLANVVLQLKKANNDISNTIEELKKNRENAATVWKEGEEQIGAKTQAIDAVTKELENTQEKLKKVLDLYQNLQKSVLEFTEEVAKLGVHGKELDDHLKTMTESINKNMEILQGFGKEDKELNQMSVTYDKLNKTNHELLLELQKQLEKARAQFEQAEKIRRMLTEKGETLAKVSLQIEQQLDRLEKTEGKEGELLDQERKIGDVYSKLGEAVQKMTHDGKTVATTSK